mgnify:CR=1 FL=1
MKTNHLDNQGRAVSTSSTSHDRTSSEREACVEGNEMRHADLTGATRVMCLNEQGDRCSKNDGDRNT